MKRFDMNKKPVKEKFYLTPIAYLLSFPSVMMRKLKITKTNMDGLRPPYILLCTHHSFIDFKVTTAALFPHRPNYIVAIDGFIKREWLLRNVGGICKRKFTNDTILYRQIKYSLEKLKNVVAIYPEARYSLVGTTAILPDSLAKMAKNLKQPVVVLNMHGNYLSQPVWNLRQRKVNLKADLTQIITKDEINDLSVTEINERIHKAFYYNEYEWQLNNNILIKEKFRAEGLHRVLYKCPHCLAEGKMNSKDHILYCEVCNKEYELNYNGSLTAKTGKTEFDHIPNWYEFERAEVRKEVDNGTYYFSDDVYVESLPNSKGYIPLGTGKLVHDYNGFHLTLNDGSLNLEKPVLSMYGVHIELNYKNKGDCISLSTLDDTYYIYPKKKNVVTKLHFGAEELYKVKREEML